MAEQEMRSADSERVWHGAGGTDYRGEWKTAIDRTEVFLSCKANARVYFAKTEHDPHSS
jgi:hypothetical protein